MKSTVISTKTNRPNLAHMDEALVKSKGRKFFGLWMDPGTMKTTVTLQDAWRWYEAGEIDAVLVLAPNNVKDGWVKWPHMDSEDDHDEITNTFRSEVQARIIKGLWISNATGEDKKCWKEFEDRIDHPQHKLIVLSVNYESLLTEQFFDFLKAFCTQFRTFIVADESTRIGKPGSKRTKRAITLRKLCVVRRALSGTPIVKSPLKIYSQAKFLDDSALPFKSFFSFRNFLCNMGGYQGRQIMSYKEDAIIKLQGWMDRWSYRARKDDCLDLPPQTFLKRRVYMTPEQVAAYKTMREEFFATVNDDTVDAKIVLAQMTRLQQITGGYLRTKDGRDIEIIPPARNPKLLMAKEILDEAPGQVVVWFRFRAELDGLKQLLKPDQYFEFHGGVPEKERSGIKGAFKRGERPYLLGTESTGGIGINQFLVADTVIHVSSDADTEKRIQADDRNHRMGSQMHEKITYFDILVPNTVDVKIHSILRNDTKLSARILKDNWREWI